MAEQIDLLQYFLKLIPDFAILDIAEKTYYVDDKGLKTEPWFGVYTIRNNESTVYGIEAYRTLLFSPVPLVFELPQTLTGNKDYNAIKIGEYHSMNVYVCYMPEDQYLNTDVIKFKVKPGTVTQDILNNTPNIIGVII